MVPNGDGSDDDFSLGPFVAVEILHCLISLVASTWRGAPHMYGPLMDILVPFLDRQIVDNRAGTPLPSLSGHRPDGARVCAYMCTDGCGGC